MAEQVGAAFMSNGRGTAGESSYGGIVVSPDASCSDLASFLRIGSSSLAPDREPDSRGEAPVQSLEGLDEERLATRLHQHQGPQPLKSTFFNAGESSPSPLRPPKIPAIAALLEGDSACLQDMSRSAPLCRVGSSPAALQPSMSGDCTNPLLKGKKVGAGRMVGWMVWDDQ